MKRHQRSSLFLASMVAGRSGSCLCHCGAGVLCRTLLVSCLFNNEAQEERPCLLKDDAKNLKQGRVHISFEILLSTCYATSNG